jgi:hypothetical protein
MPWHGESAAAVVMAPVATAEGKNQPVTAAAAAAVACAR